MQIRSKASSFVASGTQELTKNNLIYSSFVAAGSNVAALQTEALLDVQTDQWVVHTPVRAVVVSAACAPQFFHLFLTCRTLFVTSALVQAAQKCNDAL